MTKNDLIKELEGFINWIEDWKLVEDTLLFKPIKEGKWTVAEIISHIMFWDKYLLNVTLPAMKDGADVESTEDYEEINSLASAYALSEGMTGAHLIDELIESRILLVNYLRGKTEEEFIAKFTLNGEEIDRFSGYPHTMFNYVAGFVWHDNHHKKQMKEYLETVDV
ncbi:DinB family protein [Evansella tamaricis]|uniref:DinB family protein n=1 Tax=Evansella tamaricis TaxID=2069301 RepID=UPI001FE3D98E|nr:DinB family protein [Evansella tamaricis]